MWGAHVWRVSGGPSRVERTASAASRRALCRAAKATRRRRYLILLGYWESFEDYGRA